MGSKAVSKHAPNQLLQAIATGLPFEDIHINAQDYPIPNHWRVIFNREAKVQTKLFEARVKCRKFENQFA